MISGSHANVRFVSLTFCDYKKLNDARSALLNPSFTDRKFRTSIKIIWMNAQRRMLEAANTLGMIRHWNTLKKRLLIVIRRFLSAFMYLIIPKLDQLESVKNQNSFNYSKITRKSSNQLCELFARLKSGFSRTFSKVAKVSVCSFFFISINFQIDSIWLEACSEI